MRVIFLVSPVDKQVVWTVNWIWCSEIQHGKASCYLATDEEDRSANRDALQPGAKRGRPIVIAVCIFFLLNSLLITPLASRCRHFPSGAAFVSAHSDTAWRLSYWKWEIDPPIKFLCCDHCCHRSQSCSQETELEAQQLVVRILLCSPSERGSCCVRECKYKTFIFCLEQS